MNKAIFVAGGLFCGMIATSGAANALTSCNDLPDHGTVQAALDAAQQQNNGGFAFEMWATVVNRDGVVCVVAFSGGNRGDQWPGSRVISAQKASTANSFSLPGFALSTANLWAATQPGGSLWGLQHSNPVDTAVSYGAAGHSGGNAKNYGQSNDPLNGQFVGGVNVFGGGLGLYDSDGTLLGAVGVSGDSSCADHNIAWRVRDALGLDFVPAGPGAPVDNIIYDLVDDAGGNPESPSGFGHPECGGTEAAVNVVVIADCPPGDGATAGCT